jgi:hypothetical protein
LRRGRCVDIRETWICHLGVWDDVMKNSETPQFTVPGLGVVTLASSSFLWFAFLSGLPFCFWFFLPFSPSLLAVSKVACTSAYLIYLNTLISSPPALSSPPCATFISVVGAWIYMGVGEGSVMFVATILLGSVTAIGAAVPPVAVVPVDLGSLRWFAVPSSLGQRGGTTAPRTGRACWSPGKFVPARGLSRRPPPACCCCCSTQYLPTCVVTKVHRGASVTGNQKTSVSVCFDGSIRPQTPPTYSDSTLTTATAFMPHANRSPSGLTLNDHRGGNVLREESVCHCSSTPAKGGCRAISQGMCGVAALQVPGFANPRPKATTSAAFLTSDSL